MKTPFEISFSAEVLNISNKTILENFKVNFKNSYCDHIEIIRENELIVENDLIRLKPDLNWNLWVGIRKAHILIIEKREAQKTIKYRIDFSRTTIVYIFIFITFCLILFYWGVTDLDSYKYLLIMIGTGFGLQFIITYLRHWSIFKRTIKHETEYLGSYDWDNIIKNKSDLEIEKIINGQSQLPKSVIKLAKLELENRKTD